MAWAVGSLFVGIVAWMVLSNGYSWRWLALFAALPSAFVLCTFSFVQESPRWLLSNGRYEDTKEVLKTTARYNGIELTDFALVNTGQVWRLRLERA